MTDYTLEIKQYDSTDPRLGRHKRWDSRSLQYKQPATGSFADIHDVEFGSATPTLNQAALGSCVPNAGEKCLSYADLWTESDVQALLSTTDAARNEQLAVKWYTLVTKADSYPGEYPPDDTGSDGLAMAQVLKDQLGLISGYTHVTSLLAALTAGQTRPFITGTEWHGDMFNPTSEGQLKITGNVEGGHEYVVGIKTDVANKRIWMQNSWDTDWGVPLRIGSKTYYGCAWFTWDDYETLLMSDGDATPFVPLAQPAPAPTPTPTPTPNRTVDEDLATAVHKWFSGRPFFYKSTIQKALNTWLIDKGL